MRQSRYILDDKNRAFLQTVLRTSAKRRGSVQEGAVLWRAQLGHKWQTEILRGENDEEIDTIEIECP
jgi:hypothetical protein